MTNQIARFVKTNACHIINLLITHFKIISCTFPPAILPDKPTNITITNIASRSAKISWLDPKNQGTYGISNFWIGLKKYNSLNLIIVTGEVNEYKIDNLTPHTTYEISIAAGNGYGSGGKTITSVLTSEEGAW